MRTSSLTPFRPILWFHNEPDPFCQRSLPRIEGNKLLGPDDQGSGDVDNIECAAAEGRRVAGGKFVGLLLDDRGGRTQAVANDRRRYPAQMLQWTSSFLLP